MSIACGYEEEALDSGGPARPETSGTSGVVDTATTIGETTLAETSTTTDASSSEATTEAEPNDASVGFIYGVADAGTSDLECDPWAQDCPVGDKCVPWANDGGTWNATRCVDVARDARGVGEPCTAQGSGQTGIDDCEIASVCLFVDDETLEGTCVAQCGGSEAMPQCAADFACLISSGGALTLCLPTCDPLLTDCGIDQVCGQTGQSFVCMPDASGELGAHGEACQSLNDCDPGLVCANPPRVVGCENGPGCCTDFCDVTAPNPDSQCAGVMDGEVCTAWFDEGETPPGYEHVGVCLLPD